MDKKQRLANAHMIQQGASNPVPVARALSEAISEARERNEDPAQDPAVFLILHQLTWILTGHDIAATTHTNDRYNKAYDLALAAIAKETQA
jgi:hypothetical protein